VVAQYPSGSNTFVKDHKASGGLVVDFSRNPTDFPLNSYIQIRTVEKESGYYLEMTIEESGRLLNSNLSDFVWHDGQERPLRNEGTEAFEFKEFKTHRYDYGFNLGDKATGQADFDIVGTHSRIKAQQAMTARTQLVTTVLTTSGNYAATHTSAVASITGNTGTWAQSTTHRQDIKRSLNYAANIIHKDTLGVVDETQLILVINPEVALEMAECQEIVDHIKHSDHALAQIRGELPGKNSRFGLPDTLYGFPVTVENTVKVTSHKMATTAKSYVLTNGFAMLIARPGDLVAPSGGPSFSTITLFAFEEMTVESLRDERSRRVEGHVVDDIDPVMTASVTGFLFTTPV
jgi:hypothetical protein